MFLPGRVLGAMRYHEIFAFMAFAPRVVSMSTSFATSFDGLSGWRTALVQRLDELSRFLAEHELLEPSVQAQVTALRERLGHEKLVVAFVAEFSRGKSELINAIFFADTGRRVLPATPGRTTMCPVEMGWTPGEGAALSLLPIETRLNGQALAELRGQARAWKRIDLDLRDAERLADALQEVRRTTWVPLERARALGFWDDERPEDNPPTDAQGRVEVPAWRHALINYPHPLLKQGLVVLDTPGLNAIGAEPELTLGLLPSAHATVFILAADAGVTKSDMAVWRDHLGAEALERFVVLNKIDTLDDPLVDPSVVREQIDFQHYETARTLGVPESRVFPLSARQALAARIDGEDGALEASRLPDLEAALGAQLLPRRRQLLEQVVLKAAQHVESQVGRKLGQTRRQLAEQMLELRGLRGKSSAKLQMLLRRVDAETTEFEACTTRLQAMRTVHNRMLKDTLVGLSSDRVRDEVDDLQRTLQASLLKLGAKKSFIAMCERLRALLAGAQKRSGEIREMLGASFTRLNAEFGFSLALSPGPEIDRFDEDLALIERNYVQYLGLTQAMRLSQPAFMEQFRRMLVSRLRVVFENASADIELWNKQASALVDSQLRERRRHFTRRREALERVQAASGDLESRLTELESQDKRLQAFSARAGALTEALRELACAGPQTETLVPLTIDLSQDADAVPPGRRAGHG